MGANEMHEGYLGRKLCEFQNYMNNYRWDHVTPNGIYAEEGMILLDAFVSYCENGKVICEDGTELRADGAEECGSCPCFNGCPRCDEDGWCDYIGCFVKATDKQETHEGCLYGTLARWEKGDHDDA